MDDKNLIKGWPILLVLHYANKIPLHIKMQKLLFLIFSEAKIKIPYNFTKHEHGPYDPEIKIDFISLDNEGYIKAMCVNKSEKTYWIFSITEKGEEYVNKTLFKVIQERDLKRIQVLVLKYKRMEWKNLVSMVYEKYNAGRPDLDRRKEGIRNEFLRIRPLWEVNYQKNKCEHIFTSLAMIDYAIIMLNKKRFDNLDITQYNVLVNFLGDCIIYLKRETAAFSPCPENAECRKLPEIGELFQFIQYLGEKFRILPSTFSDDAYLEDFELEGGQQGDELRAAVKTT
jgi:uncharacterized protein YwgA